MLPGGSRSPDEVPCLRRIADALHRARDDIVKLKQRENPDGEAGGRGGVAALAAPDFVERGAAKAAAEDAVELRDAEGEEGTGRRNTEDGRQGVDDR
jgi:hypothetical protein